MTRTLLIVILFVLGGCAVPERDEVPSGIDATRLKAAQGDPVSQYQMGMEHLRGVNVVQDTEVAVDWFRRSANLNYAPAQYQLGLAYLNGQGVTGDKPWAMFWFGTSAYGNHARAQHQLGLAYLNGDGLPMSAKWAWQWLKLAENNGVREAVSEREEAEARLRPAVVKRAKGWVEEFQPSSVWSFEADPTVRYVQQALERLRYDPGPADGILGSQTRDAIRKYRRDARLADGDGIDRQVLERLRMDFGAEFDAAGPIG